MGEKDKGLYRHVALLKKIRIALDGLRVRAFVDCWCGNKATPTGKRCSLACEEMQLECREMKSLLSRGQHGVEVQDGEGE